MKYSSVVMVIGAAPERYILQRSNPRRAFTLLNTSMLANVQPNPHGSPFLDITCTLYYTPVTHTRRTASALAGRQIIVRQNIGKIYPNFEIYTEVYILIDLCSA